MAARDLGTNTLRPGARILAEDHQRQPSGETVRTRIFAVPGARDPVRVEERLALDATGQEQVVARSEMAAGHFLVQANKGISRATLLPALRAANVVSLDALRHEGLFRAQLDAADVRSLSNAIAVAKSLKQLVAFAEPDFVVRIFETNPDDPAYTSGNLWGLRNTGQSGGVADADIDANEA